jgi:hypothetical protein
MDIVAESCNSRRHWVTFEKEAMLMKQDFALSQAVICKRRTINKRVLRYYPLTIGSL